jgi:hypothetical protein
VANSGVSHRYDVIRHQTLCVGALSLTKANFGSRAIYIGVGGGDHCPLIKGLPPMRAWGMD